ncbi:hypothetical protein IDAT_09800 [Pseudidiomarina atlantica]|uniref:NAD(P)-binding domain-containing protein n=1 Tax=Pseudidiomarina atlantica TaxID=1517416 RepID=A0A094IR28_9GAMM|nr:NAD(P)H-binding protein [Pseudidiomarina atlantica]KFZ28289.1 hypothetical protein IDAT_09800 [Pseudidiomarina atlantica]
MTAVSFIGYGDIATRTSTALILSSYTKMRGLCRYPELKDNPAHVELIAGDAANAADIERVVTAETEVIIMTLTPNRQSDDSYHNGYVVPARILQNHLQTNGWQPRIIFVSSTGVYGQRDGSWIDESTPAEPSDGAGKSLLQAEQIIASASPHTTILRCSGIYGPERTRLAELLISGEGVITPAWTNRIHADDVAGFIAYLVQNPERSQPIFLVSDDEPLLQEDAYGRLAKRLGIDLRTIARSEEIGRRGSKRVSNRLLHASGYQLTHPTYEPR